MDDETDPVKAALSDEADLYDVASWDMRTPLDAVAVRLHAGLKRVRPWLIFVVALSLFLGQMAIVAPLVVEYPQIGILALLSVVPALLLVGYLWYGDPTMREPLEPLAMTFLLGVVFATLAGFLNTLFLPAFQSIPLVGLVLFFFVVVGPIEEAVKWLAVRVFAYKTSAFSSVVDGVVYGAAAGLGFATIENVAYIVEPLVVTAGTGDGLRYTLQTATQRAFVGPGHVIYSAFAGYYLGLAKFNPAHRGPIVVKGLVVAALLHATYNVLVSVLPLTVVTFIAFVVLYDGLWLFVLYRKVRRYEVLYAVARNRAVR